MKYTVLLMAAMAIFAFSGEANADRAKKCQTICSQPGSSANCAANCKKCHAPDGTFLCKPHGGSCRTVNGVYTCGPKFN